MSGTLFRILIVALALLIALPGSAQSRESQEDISEQYFKSQIPLGIESFFLRPSRRMLYVMSTADSPYFDGWHQIQRGTERNLWDRNGSPVRFYPRQLHFRVTATTMLELLEMDTSFLDLNGNVNDFLLRLGFRLKIFHGLDLITLEPDAVDMLGVPPDVISEERVFRANFTLPQTPIEDRLVLEVLTPTGERLCKFNLEF